jgi:hypothetical protein
MPWRSAEQLLAGEDPVVEKWAHDLDELSARGPLAPTLLSGPILAHHRQTSEPIDDGVASIVRRGSAAFYHCQAPDPDCQCSSCVRERSYQANPKLPPAAPKQPILVRVDSNGLRWYKCTPRGELVLG